MLELKKSLLLVVIGVNLLCMLPGCMSKRNQPGHPVPISKLTFAEASIILEHNATDNDAEIVVFVKGGEEGLTKLRVYAPNNDTVLDLSTKDKTVGLREFAVESAEPGVTKVIGAYPEGTYRIEGVTISGDTLQTSAILSHKLPSSPELKVDKTTGTVTWSYVADAVKYSIELEQEVNNEDVMKLTIELPPTVRSFSIPKAFLLPGQYQVGVAVHGANGNITVVEQEF